MSKKVTSIILSVILLVSVFATPCFAFTWKSVDGYGRNITDCDNDVSETRDFVYSYLDSHTELNHAAICSILGNIYVECGFQYYLTGSYNGLCQWDQSIRWKNCITRYGSDLESQCKFICYELKEGDYKTAYSKLLKVENTKDGVIQAESIFRTYYEGCGNQGRQRRQDAALMYFENLKPAEVKSIEIAEPDTVEAVIMQCFTLMVAAMKTLSIAV